MNFDELKQKIAEARLLGCTAVTVEGVTYQIGSEPQVEKNVPELKAEEIVNPLSVLDEMDEDEITYWATPYYEELQAKKAALSQAARDQIKE
jgi:hypothetical protein